VPANAQKGAGEILGTRRMIYPDVDDFGWKDITAAVTVRGVGANDPTWAQIGTSEFYGYNFALGDECWFVFHVPHDIVPNGLVHFHTHWLSDGTDANIVRWQFDYTYARGFNQEAFNMAGTTITAEEAASGTAYQHMVTESDGQQIANLDEPDGLILCRVSRVTNGGTNNTDNIFLLTADLHYQSTGRATYGKAPNFYTG